MKIKTFYHQSRCEHTVYFENLIYEVGRKDVLRKAVSMMCNYLASDSPPEKIIALLRKYLDSEYAKLEMSQFAWQQEAYVNNDTFLFERIVYYLCSNYTFEKQIVSTHMELPCVFSDGTSCLDGKVDIIMKDIHGNYHGFIIHTGTCSRSMKGRSMLTSAAFDLHCMVAKYCLEDEYPEITVHAVYLSHKNDTPKDMVKQLEISGTASSNMHSLSYSDYYTNGIFDKEFFTTIVMNVVNAPKETTCFDCKWSNLCKTPRLELNSDKSIESTEGKPYVMPQYTEQQRKVVTHKDGPMLVCAGPGSGKTAALIGRIRYLVEECKVDSKFILVVTFTTNAAAELRQRCLSFLPEENLPNIATLHSFCYKVLRDNADLLETGINILSPGENLHLIKNLTSVFPPLTGFSYEKKLGRTGLYMTLERRLNEYLSMADYEFYQKNPTLGTDFGVFAQKYKETLECRGFISFDEQISLCNKLFAEYPEVLNIYQRICKYVMVDEYQDVNEEQVKMLYALASHGNIVVVGDDDQTIYGFRGSSADYMIQFPKHYSGCKTVILNDNFRSTKALVDASQSLITNNRNRIKKDIVCGNDAEGLLPIVISDLSVSTIDRLIDNLLQEGYRYQDIAILSSKNAPLEELHGSLKAPSILAKSYLREDGFFVFTRCVLKILCEECVPDAIFLQYLKLFGKDKYIARERGLSLYEATLNAYGYDDVRKEEASMPMEGSCLYDEMMILIDMQALLYRLPSIKMFLDTCRYRINWQQSDGYDVLLEQLDQQRIRSIHDMLSFMDYLVDFEDDKRVEQSEDDRITLITCHDAKGKEYPIVIIRNDFTSYSDESRRLFYVAVTRAGKLAYILQDNDCKVNFLNEIPHVMEDGIYEIIIS